MKIEKYTNGKGEIWVRIRFTDKYKTEIIMTESNFAKAFGKLD